MSIINGKTTIYSSYKSFHNPIKSETPKSSEIPSTVRTIKAGSLEEEFFSTKTNSSMILLSSTLEIPKATNS